MYVCVCVYVYVCLYIIFFPNMRSEHAQLQSKLFNPLDVRLLYTNIYEKKFKQGINITTKGKSFNTQK